MSERRTYTRAFKLEALRLAKESGNVTGTARNLGIAQSLLWRWKKKYEDEGERAFPGKGHASDDELSKLHRRLRQLEEENAILKKAVGIFTKNRP